MLAGPRLHRRHLEDRVRALAAQNGVRIATQSASKAMLDESHPANLGVYAGTFTREPETRRRVDGARPLVLAGVVMTDFLTGSFTHGFDPDAAVDLHLDHARIAGAAFYGLFLRSPSASSRRSWRPGRRARPRCRAAPRRADRRAHARRPRRPAHARRPVAAAAGLADPGTLVVAEAGTSFYGALELTLPDGCDLLGQPVWSSIGYTLPATLGAMLAAPERRRSSSSGTAPRS